MNIPRVALLYMFLGLAGLLALPIYLLLARGWIHRLRWTYFDEEHPSEFAMLIRAIREWWRCRPRRIECVFCGRPLWQTGYRDDAPIYCDKYCAYNDGLLDEEEDGEIPF